MLLASGISQVGPLGWIRRRMIPVGAFLIVTEPLSPDQLKRLMPTGRMVVDTRNLVVYWRLTPDNRLLFGGRARFAASNPQSDEKSGRILKAAMVEVYPELADTRIDYCWGGMVDMTRDRLPRAGERDGIYYSMGYSGHGTQMSTLMGTIMADVMDGHPELQSLEGFRLAGDPRLFRASVVPADRRCLLPHEGPCRVMTPLEHLSRNGHLDKFFIDGQWVEPRGAAKGVVVNPATEEVVSQFPLGNGEDVDAAVAAARRAFAAWSRTTPEYRAGLLDRLQALLEARSELLAQCLTLEMGAAIGYARSAQVPLAIAHVQGRQRGPDGLPLRQAARPDRHRPRTDRRLCA